MRSGHRHGGHAAANLGVGEAGMTCLADSETRFPVLESTV